ncbi:MAG: CYTH domain-containing protein [Alphaproteobacteria bacterium]|nr:CYTH domain-containing protein [Alphaproteobacteria bacterium]
MIMGLFDRNQTNIEIERKFLIVARPTEKPERRHKIRQGYIAREARNVVRIRDQDGQYILSVKTPAKGIGRFEIETNISTDEGKVLFAACARPPIEKIREIYPVKGHIWELDIFTGDNKGLIVAEVELSSETEEVMLPDWIGPEVTGLKKFYNANLSLRPFKSWGVTYADLVARMDG